MEVKNRSLLINIIITKLSIKIQILLWTIMETVFTLHYNCEFIFPSTFVKVESKPKLSSWYYCIVKYKTIPLVWKCCTFQQLFQLQRFVRERVCSSCEIGRRKLLVCPSSCPWSFCLHRPLLKQTKKVKVMY